MTEGSQQSSDISGAKPFAKVTRMVRQLLNKQLKVRRIGTLEARLKANKAENSANTLELSKAKKDLADSKVALTNATNLRKKENAGNLIKIKEYTDAAKLITDAVAVLKAYYGKSNTKAAGTHRSWED